MAALPAAASRGVRVTKIPASRLLRSAHPERVVSITPTDILAALGAGRFGELVRDRIAAAVGVPADMLVTRLQQPMRRPAQLHAATFGPEHIAALREPDFPGVPSPHVGDRDAARAVQLSPGIGHCPAAEGESARSGVPALGDGRPGGKADRKG